MDEHLLIQDPPLTGHEDLPRERILATLKTRMLLAMSLTTTLLDRIPPVVTGLLLFHHTLRSTLATRTALPMNKTNRTIGSQPSETMANSITIVRAGRVLE
jgi:hypothetical protein